MLHERIQPVNGSEAAGGSSHGHKVHCIAQASSKDLCTGSQPLFSAWCMLLFSYCLLIPLMSLKDTEGNMLALQSLDLST